MDRPRDAEARRRALTTRVSRDATAWFCGCPQGRAVVQSMTSTPYILRGGTTMAILDRPAVFTAPGEAGSPVSLKPRYENFIGGEWVAPVDGL
jgi:hypothetical protein